MSILMGIAGGLGDAGQQVAQQNAKIWADQDMAKLTSDLALEKQKALEQFKLDQTRAEKSRIGGIVSQARQTAIDNAHQGDDPLGPNPPASAYNRLGDRAAIQALTDAGEVEAAAQLDKLRDSGKKVVPWGSAYTDEDGNVLYDNGSVLKGTVQKETADAKATAAAGKGAPKQLTQQQLDQITAQSQKIVQANMGFTKNPFSQPGEDQKTAADSAKQALLANSLGTISANAAASGKTINPSQAFAELKPLADKYDQQVTSDARKYAGQFFDDKGRLKDGALGALQKLNLPDAATQDKTSFMRYYRDTMLTDIDQFRAFRKSAADGNSGSGGAEGKPADDAPTKPPIVPAVRESASSTPPAATATQSSQQTASRADALGSSFTERQSELLRREQQADSDQELRSLMQQKAKALQDGKPVLANQFIARYNQLRKERYGL